MCHHGWHKDSKHQCHCSGLSAEVIGLSWLDLCLADQNDFKEPVTTHLKRLDLKNPQNQPSRRNSKNREAGHLINLPRQAEEARRKGFVPVRKSNTLVNTSTCSMKPDTRRAISSFEAQRSTEGKDRWLLQGYTERFILFIHASLEVHP